MIEPGKSVFFFGTTNKEWIIHVGVTDKDIIRLSLLDSASVSFDAYPGMEFPAKVTEFAEAVNPLNGTFEVELQMKENPYKLISGFVSRVKIFPAIKKQFYVIPVESLV